MKSAPRNLSLLHTRTHQRYPLHGSLVIGRAAGDLVFDHDPKLSSKHCLIKDTEAGPAIYDLKSRTGVFVNGAHLPTDKACLLKAGCEIKVGDQSFTVEDDQRSSTQALVLTVAALSAVVFTMVLILTLAQRDARHAVEVPGSTPALTN